MKNTKQIQSGFTLIELIVVITIIGILAAFAIPKYTALQADARIAKMTAAMGSMKAAASMAHAQLLTKGYGANFSGTPASPAFTIEGVTPVYTNGYPTAGTIAQLAGIDTVQDYTVTVDNTATPNTATVAPDANHASCSVVYSESTAANTPPTYSTAGLTAANCQ